jgi:hypothetical protein
MTCCTGITENFSHSIPKPITSGKQSSRLKREHTNREPPATKVRCIGRCSDVIHCFQDLVTHAKRGVAPVGNEPLGDPE